MVTIIEYNKITIDFFIYIKVFSDGTVSYIKFSADNVLNTTNNRTAFTEIRRVVEEDFEIKVQEGSVLKYLNFQIYQSTPRFSVDQTYHIMELINEWFPTGKFREFDTPFTADYTYENEPMAALTLTVNSLHKVEMGYYGKFGHTIGRIQ